MNVKIGILASNSAGGVTGSLLLKWYSFVCECVLSKN
jgi:hypothetical protein